MPTYNHTVLVLDDDRSILQGLERLLAARGYKVRLFSESEDLFKAGLPEVPAILILDNQLNDGMTGMQVHAEMQRRGWEIPVVFITAYWDVQAVVNAMRAGADGFLSKPIDPVELMDAVKHSLGLARQKRNGNAVVADARARVALLTARERDVVRLVVSGLLNKEIADQLNIAMVTVKVHRGRAMQKLGAGNPAELARIAALGGLVD